MGRINEKELKSLDPVSYSGTHQIGKTGIERFYEPELHGQVGYEEVETNARGRVLRVLMRTEPVPGKDIVLSLDVKLQEAAEAALGDRRGSVVALDPSTGEVLAMVSKPSFDPNLFVTGISFKEYAALHDSIDRPLFNRVLRGLYPPEFDHQARGGDCRAGRRGGHGFDPRVRPGLLPAAQLRSQIP